MCVVRHQDDAYAAPAGEHRRVSCWVPLQEASIEGGCMQFVREGKD
eukprot:SAG22_NODE_817_length_7026_cov_13.636206_6_plen_46_part_00